MSEASEPAIRITPDMLIRRRVDFERRMRRLPPLTLALVGVLTAIFAAEVWLEVLGSAEDLILVGALSRDAVMQGEWWRVITAVFLHGGVDHLVGNMIALYVLGMVCEHAFGRAQFLALFVLGGLGGSVLSMVTSPGPSVGASGAIFGLQGAAVVLFRRHRERLLVRDRRIGIVLIVWALYTIASGLVTPYVDNGAHIGGFIAGALIARSLHPVLLGAPDAATLAHIRRLRWISVVVLVLALAGWVVR